MEDFELHRADPEDAGEIARTVELGFDGYRAFMPAGWEPPPAEWTRLHDRLADAAVWCLLARSEGAPAGHVSLMPAAIHGAHPDSDPRLAHLWQLFVRELHWGSGLAARLLDAAVEEARRRGYDRFRLYCAARQRRARRFYEREGWSAAGAPTLAPDIEMELIEYRRDLR